jgi:TctA family transporter
MVFVEGPISATLLACGAGLLVWSIWGAVKRTARERAEEDAGTSAATQST